MTETMDAPSASESASIAARVDALAWADVENEVDAQGNAVMAGLLTPAECAALTGHYVEDARFRKRVVMEQHGYGRGEYGYYAYPLPATVEALRGALYRHLAPLANRWHHALGLPAEFPSDHADYLARCHAAGQVRPTPLQLKYAAGDFNCLHQDLYGEHVFPLQVAILLSQPGRDFEGGEFVLTEQRPRMQSRAEVVPLRRGDAVVFAVRDRPVRGARGTCRMQMRHGISRLRRGHRHTLGIIFHDAM